MMSTFETCKDGGLCDVCNRDIAPAEGFLVPNADFYGAPAYREKMSAMASIVDVPADIYVQQAAAHDTRPHSLVCSHCLPLFETEAPPTAPEEPEATPAPAEALPETAVPPTPTLAVPVMNQSVAPPSSPTAQVTPPTYPGSAPAQHANGFAPQFNPVMPPVQQPTNAPVARPMPYGAPAVPYNATPYGAQSAAPAYAQQNAYGTPAMGAPPPRQFNAPMYQTAPPSRQMPPDPRSQSGQLAQSRIQTQPNPANRIPLRAPQQNRKKSKLWLLIGGGVLLAVIILVVLYFVLLKPGENKSLETAIQDAYADFITEQTNDGSLSEAAVTALNEGGIVDLEAAVKEQFDNNLTTQTLTLVVRIPAISATSVTLSSDIAEGELLNWLKDSSSLVKDGLDNQLASGVIYEDFDATVFVEYHPNNTAEIRANFPAENVRLIDVFKEDYMAAFLNTWTASSVSPAEAINDYYSAEKSHEILQKALADRDLSDGGALNLAMQLLAPVIQSQSVDENHLYVVTYTLQDLDAFLSSFETYYSSQYNNRRYPLAEVPDLKAEIFQNALTFLNETYEERAEHTLEINLLNPTKVMDSVTTFLVPNCDKMINSLTTMADDMVVKLKANALVAEARPETALFTSPAATSSSIVYEIKAQNGLDHYVFFKGLDGASDYAGYIRTGETLTVSIPFGRYEFSYCFGTDWYGRTDLFGPNGTYKTWGEPFEDEAGQGYTLTLSMPSGGTTSASEIEPDEFPH